MINRRISHSVFKKMRHYIKYLFCKHNWTYISYGRMDTTDNLYCNKCKVLMVDEWHYNNMSKNKLIDRFKDLDISLFIPYR